jgi:hypothetical protein
MLKHQTVQAAGPVVVASADCPVDPEKHSSKENQAERLQSPMCKSAE